MAFAELRLFVAIDFLRRRFRPFLRRRLPNWEAFSSASGDRSPSNYSA
jgi:hypothetical protein